MYRPRPLILVALVAAVLVAAPAMSQERPPKPYPPVAVTLPAPSTDDSLAAFRAQLAAVAKGRIYAELAPLVRSQGFFWDRDYRHAFDTRKPAVDNLAAALALEAHNGRGWVVLSLLAAEAAVEPMTARPDVLCAPARPTFEGTALARLLDTTYTDEPNWVYPRADRTPVRAAPQPEAPEIGSFGLHFVRLIGYYEGDESEPAPERTRWARIVLPDGKTGFVAPNSVLSLRAERLCYIKHLIGGWRIAGFVSSGSP